MKLQRRPLDVRVADGTKPGVVTVTVGFPNWHAVEFANRSFVLEITE
jgi:hypothetical protein